MLTDEVQVLRAPCLRGHSVQSGSSFPQGGCLSRGHNGQIARSGPSWTARDRRIDQLQALVELIEGSLDPDASRRADGRAENDNRLVW